MERHAATSPTPTLCEYETHWKKSCDDGGNNITATLDLGMSLQTVWPVKSGDRRSNDDSLAEKAIKPTEKSKDQEYVILSRFFHPPNPATPTYISNQLPEPDRGS